MLWLSVLLVALNNVQRLMTIAITLERPNTMSARERGAIPFQMAKTLVNNVFSKLAIRVIKYITM